MLLAIKAFSEDENFGVGVVDIDEDTVKELRRRHAVLKKMVESGDFPSVAQIRFTDMNWVEYYESIEGTDAEIEEFDGNDVVRCPPKWDRIEDQRTYSELLVVHVNGDVWWVAYGHYSDTVVETERLSIDDLEKLLQPPQETTMAEVP